MQKSRARQQLALYHDLYLRIFEFRCIMCGKPTNVLHEIIPISHGKSSLVGKNRVPLCLEHHTWAHESTKKSIPILVEKRKEFLRRKWQGRTGRIS